MPRLARFLLALVAGGVAVGIFGALLVPAIAKTIGASEHEVDLASLRPLAEPSTLYANDGTTVIARLGVEDREPVTYDEIPPLVIDAVVASEDPSYWTNNGIDLRAGIRALSENVEAGGIAQGGSTITQQLVKLRLLSTKRDFSRKSKEIFLAMEMTEEYSKEEILEQYFNTVYFGQGSYGIRAAARRTFGVELRDLTLGQASLLAGLIQNPEGANPFEYPERAQARREYVLRRMVEEGYVTQAEADAAVGDPLPTTRPPAELRPDNYFVEEVQRRLLEDPRLGSTQQERYNAVQRGGLKVYTSLDLDSQWYAQLAVNEVLPDQPPFTAALVAIEPSRGEVRAIVGGPNFSDTQFNLATQGKRQPGSTYKVITLAAALENGFSVNDTISGTSPCTINVPGYSKWDTKNAEGSGGTMTLRAATTGSVNCAYARLIAAVGVPKVVDMAHAMGIKGEVPEFLSITLGTAGASPLEMATVFATIANDGVRNDPIFVRKVEDSNGKIVFEEKPTGVRAMSVETARTLQDVLQGVVTGGTGTAARISGREVFGKTGTTDNKGNAWFAGCVVQECAAVWMGAPEGTIPMTRVGGITVYGGTYPARIWRAYMATAIDGMDPVPFSNPNTRLWPAPKFISEKGRGVGSPPPEDEEVTEPVPTPPSSTTAPSGTTVPTTAAPSTTTTVVTTTTAPPPVPTT